eukprot:maker-scaffold_11-snap-gene-4.40-mRNA-1 protein AED:0.02 eAED:0.02 QI:80/1/1/1/1/1/3/157/410
MQQEEKKIARNKMKPQRNVFQAATALAKKYNSINLGQGFPSFETPNFVKQFAAEAITNNLNQYTRPGGSPGLVDTLADIYNKRYNLPDRLQGMDNICAFNGAQHGVFLILSTLCEEGDEIVCVEPYFDAYRKTAELLKLKVKAACLKLNKSSMMFELDMEDFKSCITEKTKVVVLNTPHNPTGKVFSKEEIAAISEILSDSPSVAVLADEVYEFMTFDGLKHHSFLEAGLKNEVIGLYSAGKTFSCTGWRVGYTIASKTITEQLILNQSVMSFCGATPLEYAIEKSFMKGFEENYEGKGCTYFEDLSLMLQVKRDKLAAGLRGAGLNPTVAEGGYFLLVDMKKLKSEINVATDEGLNEWLTKEVGITGIPVSSFYGEANKQHGDGVMRFAFCKTDEEIEAAVAKLKKLQL